MARTFFVSDCHLNEDRPRIVELFIQFLYEYASSGNALYILGDLFDYWIGDDAPLGKLTPVVDHLRDVARHVPVHFIHGNRDFLIGKRFSEDSGCRLLDETSVIDIQGQRTLLMHGDLLCTDDLSYQRYRKIVRSGVLCATTTRLPLNVRLSIAKYLRSTSTREMQSKKPEIMDVNDDTVTDYACKFKVNQIIHGHTHRPAIHKEQANGQAWRRIVLGDWYDHGSYLVVENGIPELKILECQS